MTNSIPIAIITGGTTIITRSIVEAIRSVKKKIKKQSSQRVTIIVLSPELILNKIKHLQSLNDKSKHKTKEKLAKTLIEIEQDLLKKLAEQEIKNKKLLSEQENLIKEINLISLEISRIEKQIEKTNEPVQNLEKNIHQLQEKENKVNELLAEIQVINSESFEIFDDIFISIQQNQRSFSL